MDTRRLGQSDLLITRLGLGAWAIGGPWLFGWGPQDDRESIAVIQHALSRGLNWIDTAAAYGLGHSEEVVGRALAGIPPGQRPYVFTKCSLVWDEHRTVTHNLRPDSIRRECEGSLRRLGVEAIDLYQIHWPRWGSSPAGHDPGPLEDAWEAMAGLQREGKVRHIGVSNCTAEDMARLAPIAPITSLQPPYSILRREIEESVLPWCQAHEIGVIVYSPMQSGLLSGRMTRERIAALPDDDWRRRSAWFQEPKLSTALHVADELRSIAARHHRSPADVAIAWTLRHPAVTGAIVGARRPEQVDGFVGAGDLRLTDEDAAEIDAAMNASAAR